MRYDIISERRARYQAVIKSPADAYDQLKRYASKKQEQFLVLTLDGSHTIIRLKLISMGLVNRTIVHPREVFKHAISDAASSIVIAHNHPSGKLEPSTEDLEITQRIIAAGDIIGILVLDHIIFAPSGYCSLKELGHIK
ncbi:MAG: DNA repair protein RadC [Spirochaetes bacterium GWD1_61_31]|nr:MAG: DNA repair protein RadC [Spirochaetes bacterium GWD1_61_31]